MGVTGFACISFPLAGEAEKCARVSLAFEVSTWCAWEIKNAVLAGKSVFFVDISNIQEESQHSFNLSAPAHIING